MHLSQIALAHTYLILQSAEFHLAFDYVIATPSYLPTRYFEITLLLLDLVAQCSNLVLALLDLTLCTRPRPMFPPQCDPHIFQVPLRIQRFVTDLLGLQLRMVDLRLQRFYSPRHSALLQLQSSKLTACSVSELAPGNRILSSFVQLVLHLLQLPPPLLHNRGLGTLNSARLATRHAKLGVAVIHCHALDLCGLSTHLTTQVLDLGSLGLELGLHVDYGTGIVLVAPSEAVRVRERILELGAQVF
mmetsp:Transcript_19959/g.55690  ORF Transcript_19959/g.55690 Transcript_19959/m.55690 type:complete len:245 (-) Transcript_19959:13-747(-)